MSIESTIKNSTLGLKGATQQAGPHTDRNHTLHNTSGLNGTPARQGLVPSELDLDGKRPSEYKNNAPDGARI